MNVEGLVEVVLPGAVEPEGLQVRSGGTVPSPGPGQVVIKMEATGVSFAEQQMRRGRYYDQPPFPFVPGYDLVGTVAATGEGVAPATASGPGCAPISPRSSPPSSAVRSPPGSPPNCRSPASPTPCGWPNPAPSPARSC